MARHRFYKYELVNPEKFTNGGNHLVLRSSWERDFAEHCDLLPSVLSWGYESVQIPYRDPLSGNQKVYIPDFFVKMATRDGYSVDKVFEIKPMHEQNDENARNRKDAALIARNNAKWEAAVRWCQRHSAEFEVLNESNLYLGHENRKPRVNPVKGFAHTQTTKPTTKITKPQNTRERSVTKNVSRMQERISRTRKARSSGRVGKAKKR